MIAKQERQQTKHAKWSIFLLTLWLLLLGCEFQTADAPAATLPTAVPTAILTTDQSPIANPPAQSTIAPLPTYTPTPLPDPSPTPDPTLADWTVMIYMNGDNSLNEAARQDLAEMTTAVASPRINILIQHDPRDGDTEQYRLGDPPTYLGETNMGDPTTLAEFIAWGLETYPAQRTALILWDHGAGWQGVSFDDNPADNLSLPDLGVGLDTGLAGRQLDVIAFDACLMGTLDVLQAIAPYAQIAVASPELTPGGGWDYGRLLDDLAANPAQTGAQLAKTIVANYADDYAQNDFVMSTAVDLRQIAPLTYAFETLAAQLAHQPELAHSAVSDARVGAEAFARSAPDFEQVSAIDLRHLTHIIAQRSPDSAITQAANDVATAVGKATIAHTAGAGFRNSGGIAIYFPQQANQYDATYDAISQLPYWRNFLTSYYQTGVTAVAPPAIQLTTVVSQAISTQQPAYLEFEISGRHIADVALIGGRYDENGRARLLEYDRLIPEPLLLADGTQLNNWRDGVHEDFFTWNTEATYLSDAAGNGEFVVLWPTAPNSPLYTVQGQWCPVTGDGCQPANLVYDQANRRFTQAWTTNNGGQAEFQPQPGDTFQLDAFYREADSTISREPGITLTFDEASQLYLNWLPLPDGNYFLGFEVANSAGATAVALTDLTINNNATTTGYTGYLDPYLGFRFLYPDDWYTPIYTNTLLYSASNDGQTYLQVTLYPNLPNNSTATTLKNDTLARFGPVDILFAEEIVIGQRRGLRTAYGYTANDGIPHTGIFLTFVDGRTGYVIDVDGLLEREGETVTAVDTLMSSWQFLPDQFGLKPGNWAELNLDAFSVPQPADFTYQEANGWQRFSKDYQTFVALRVQPSTTPTNDVLNTLLRDAGAGLNDFTVTNSRPFPLDDLLWQRADFSYTANDGTPIWGFIMVTEQNGQELVAWAEAPTTTYNNLEGHIFIPMIATLTLD